MPTDLWAIQPTGSEVTNFKKAVSQRVNRDILVIKIFMDIRTIKDVIGIIVTKDIMSSQMSMTLWTLWTTHSSMPVLTSLVQQSLRLSYNI